MMRAFFLPLLLFWAGDTKLETEIFLGESRPEYFRLIPEGLATSDSVFIRLFDRSGKLIQTFGGKGDGPGQFQRIGCLNWFKSAEGIELLGVYDVRRLDLSIFELNGKFRGRISMLARDVHPLGGEMAIVDLNDMAKTQAQSGNALSIGKVHLEESGKPIFKERLAFHPYSEKLIKQRFGDSEHLIVDQGQRWLVMASIAPELFVYSHDGSLLGKHRLSFYAFEESPEEVPRINNRKAGESWMASHSRIIGLYPSDKDGFYVHYAIPNETLNPREMIQWVAFDTWDMGPRVEIAEDERLLGIEHDQIFTLHLNDNDFTPVYTLRARLFKGAKD